MNVNYLFGFQIATDVLICAGILFLLLRFRKYFKPSPPEISEQTIEEFSQLLNESRIAANKFLQELEQEKKDLKDLAAAVEEREIKLQELITQAKNYGDLIRSDNMNMIEEMEKSDKADSFSEGPYSEILNLARKGLNEEKIAQQLGLPEGEIELVLNLFRERSK